MPSATITQVSPRRLHSEQTLVSGISGLRPTRNADITSSSWCLSIGQPRSSKSTGTCAAIGVDVASVSMYCGLAYTAARNSSTSAKLRSACMPPAVAQAPIVISTRDCSRTRWMRSTSSAVVTDPSTSDTSYGPGSTFRDASRKCAIVT